MWTILWFIRNHSWGAWSRAKMALSKSWSQYSCGMWVENLSGNFAVSLKFDVGGWCRLPQCRAVTRFPPSFFDFLSRAESFLHGILGYDVDWQTDAKLLSFKASRSTLLFAIEPNNATNQICWLKYYKKLCHDFDIPKRDTENS